MRLGKVKKRNEMGRDVETKHEKQMVEKSGKDCCKNLLSCIHMLRYIVLKFEIIGW